MEEEFIKNQERLKPQEEKQEVSTCDQLRAEYFFLPLMFKNNMTEKTCFGKYDGFRYLDTYLAKIFIFFLNRKRDLKWMTYEEHPCRLVTWRRS